MYAIRSYYGFIEEIKHRYEQDEIRMIKRILIEGVRKNENVVITLFERSQMYVLNSRITSYNVCYTKLLRFYCQVLALEMNIIAQY